MAINELTADTADFNLLEADGTAAVASTVHWRVKCLETDRALTEWAEVTVTYTTGEDESVVEAGATFAIPATVHAMQTAGLAVERKALIIVADKGLATEWNTEMVYEVERLNARS